MKPVKTLSAALVMSALLVALSGCEKQEGPMEKAGKSVDNATESVGEHVENAGEAIQDAAKGDKK
jgi:predicted small secreted protein